MHTKAEFMRAICSQPDDDTVRLVFADWLEENGEPERAIAIRSMIAAYRIYSERAVIGSRTQYALSDSDKDVEFGRLMSVASAFASNPQLNGLSPTLQELARDNRLLWKRGFVYGLHLRWSMPAEVAAPFRTCILHEPVQLVTFEDIRPLWNTLLPPDTGIRFLFGWREEGDIGRGCLIPRHLIEAMVRTGQAEKVIYYQYKGSEYAEAETEQEGTYGINLLFAREMDAVKCLSDVFLQSVRETDRRQE